MIQQLRNSFLIWYGMRVGADVEVLRPAAEQQVAHAAADEVGGVVELLQPIQHFERVRIDVPPRNRVLRPRDDHRLWHPTSIVPRRYVHRAAACMRVADACMCYRACVHRWLCALPVASCLVCWRWSSRWRSDRVATRADLAKARSLYNQRQFDDAIEAAHRRPEDAGDGRCRDRRARARAPRTLSRARRPGRPDGGARGAWHRPGRRPRRPRPGRVPARARRVAVPRRRLRRGRGDVRERARWRRAHGSATGEAMLDWWGSAVERQADALDRELARAGVRPPRAIAWRRAGAAAPAPRRPLTGSSSARAAPGDPAAAWDAAVAGWVRARLAGERSAALRADLDKLVLEGIIPDRVRTAAPDERAQPESRSAQPNGNW